jgi:sortase A
MEERGWRRALPQVAIWGVILAGVAMVAQALYIPAKAELAQVLLNRAFAESVASGEPAKPWPWADTAPIARVSVKRLEISEIVLSGGSGEAMAFGPTQVLTAPQSRVTLLTAHRDTHFEFVRDLTVGDGLSLDRIDGSTAQYRITGFTTVRWDEFAYPTSGTRELLVLATCYPFDTDTPGPLRRIVWAERVQ